MFYFDGIKRVPYDLVLLTPLALAHWIMQDGAKGTSGGFYLCTDAFPKEDVLRLAKYLNEVYGLKISTPLSPNKKGLRIYVAFASRSKRRKSSVQNLICLVKPFMHPSMMYKFDF